MPRVHYFWLLLGVLLFAACSKDQTDIRPATMDQQPQAASKAAGVEQVSEPQARMGMPSPAQVEGEIARELVSAEEISFAVDPADLNRAMIAVDEAEKQAAELRQDIEAARERRDSSQASLRAEEQAHERLGTALAASAERIKEKENELRTKPNGVSPGGNDVLISPATVAVTAGPAPL